MATDERASRLSDHHDSSVLARDGAGELGWVDYRSVPRITGARFVSEQRGSGGRATRPNRKVELADGRGRVVSSDEAQVSDAVLVEAGFTIQWAAAKG
jgi:hypothetical protein